ncbi:MAG: hypothetical protein GY705_07185, partial [Bacteroidetes bacterium]|nr:hypothetical protein [Bacteroidota bacterium]
MHAILFDTKIISKAQNMTPINPEIGIQTKKEIAFVDKDDIIYILAEGSYAHFMLKNKQRIIVARKLGEIEQSLPPYFLRIHHSHIINLR